MCFITEDKVVQTSRIRETEDVTSTSTMRVTRSVNHYTYQIHWLIRLWCGVTSHHQAILEDNLIFLLEPSKILSKVSILGFNNLMMSCLLFTHLHQLLQFLNLCLECSFFLSPFFC